MRSIRRTQIARFQDPWLKDHGRVCVSRPRNPRIPESRFFFLISKRRFLPVWASLNRGFRGLCVSIKSSWHMKIQNDVNEMCKIPKICVLTYANLNSLRGGLEIAQFVFASWNAMRWFSWMRCVGFLWCYDLCNKFVRWLQKIVATCDAMCWFSGMLLSFCNNFARWLQTMVATCDVFVFSDAMIFVTTCKMITKDSSNQTPKSPN